MDAGGRAKQELEPRMGVMLFNPSFLRKQVASRRKEMLNNARFLAALEMTIILTGFWHAPE
jgi:hypothetical protein